MGAGFEKPDNKITSSPIIGKDVFGIIPEGESKIISLEAKKEKEELKKQILLNELLKPLEFKENHAKNTQMEILEINNNHEYSLFSSIQQYCENGFFNGKGLFEYFKQRVDELESLGISEEKKIEISIYKDSLYNEISKIADNLTAGIIEVIGESNLSNISSIKIENGKLLFKYKDSNNIEIFSLELNENKSGLSVKKLSEIDLVKNNQKVEQREQLDESNKIKFFGGALVLGLVFDGAKKVYSLKTIEFVDSNGKLQKVRLGKEIKGDKAVLIKEALLSIKNQFGYDIKIEGDKLHFEIFDKNIDLLNIREEVNKLTFENFKENMKKSGLSEEILKQEFSKQKFNIDSFLNGIEKQYGKKVNPTEFLKNLLSESVSSKFGLGLHIILHPIFFSEVQKKGGNLDSYFKSGAEMALFNYGARKAVLGATKGLNKLGIYGKVVNGFVQLVGGILGGAAGVSLGSAVAGITKMQKGFDTIVPENEDLFYKYLGRKNDSIVSYLGVGGYAFEIADSFGTDIGIPGTPIKFWEHNINLGTEKREYMSVGLTRTKEFFNDRVDDLSKDLLEKIKIYIQKYNNSFSKTKKGDENSLIHRKNLEKNLQKLILKGENPLLEKTIYGKIESNLDNLLSGKHSFEELSALISIELESLKISGESIDLMGKDLNFKKAGIDFILKGKLHNEITNDMSEEEQMASMMPNYDMIEYFNSLTDREKQFMIDYYNRTINKQEIIRETDADIYNSLINDNNKIKLESGKLVSKGEMFHKFSAMVKDLKEDIYFLRRIKETNSLLDTTKIDNGKIIKYKEGYDVKKYPNGIEVINNNKKMFIALRQNGMLEYIQLGDKKFSPNITGPDGGLLIGKNGVEISYIYPFVFLNDNNPQLSFRRANNDINSKFVRMEDISFKELFNLLENNDKPVLMEDYELYFDLELILTFKKQVQFKTS